MSRWAADSLAGRIARSGRTFVFYHTHQVTTQHLDRAIALRRSMDLDVCIDEETRSPYLGHSPEYYAKVPEPRLPSMPLWEAVERIAHAGIPAMVDCKHREAWPVVEEVVTRIGPANCLVHAFATEFDYPYVNHSSYSVECEWAPIRKLKELKTAFPSLTTTASARGLPEDLLVHPGRHARLVSELIGVLRRNEVDTICLNVPDHTFSDGAISLFLAAQIIPHVMIDDVDVSGLSQLYIGESDSMESASDSMLLRSAARSGGGRSPDEC